MTRMYGGGMTLTEVAAAFGVSRQAVTQLLERAEVPLRSPAAQGSLRAAGRREAEAERRVEAVALFRESGDYGAVAAELEMPRAAVRRVVRDALEGSALYRLRRARKRYGDAELLECLREAARELGQPLGEQAYDALAAGRALPGGRSWPTSQTICLRLGGWATALEEAGLEARRTGGQPRTRWSAGDCTEALREAARLIGRPPTPTEYERLASARGGAWPSASTVRKRCGPWREVILAARL